MILLYSPWHLRNVCLVIPAIHLFTLLSSLHIPMSQTNSRSGCQMGLLKCWSPWSPKGSGEHPPRQTMGFPMARRRHHQLLATPPRIKSKDRCIAEVFSVNFLIELTYLYVDVVRILLLHLLEKAGQNRLRSKLVSWKVMFALGDSSVHKVCRLRYSQV